MQRIKTTIVLMMGVFLFATPVFTSASPSIADISAQISRLLAQVQELQTQLRNLQRSPSCVYLSYDLYSDQTDSNTNGEVSKLQSFLGGPVTGYFGPKTLRLVQDWQSSRGIVYSGSPDTTGYGYVGARTRALMAQGCHKTPSENVSFTISPTLGKTPLLVEFNSKGLNPNYQYTIDYGDNSMGGGFNNRDCYEYKIGCGDPVPYRHTYKKSGTYTASLQRLTRCGPMANSCKNPDDYLFRETVGTVTVYVYANEENSPLFTANPISGHAPLLVEFSIYLPATEYYEIDYGDESNRIDGASTGSYKHVYERGNYIAKLSRFRKCVEAFCSTVVEKDVIAQFNISAW